MAEKVGERLREAGRAGRTVQLKLRYADFRTITRSRTLPEATDTAGEIAPVAVELLRAVDLGDGIRLLGRDGAAAGGGGRRSRRGSTSTPSPTRHATTERRPSAGGARGRGSVDAVRERFGEDASARRCSTGARTSSRAEAA